MCGIVGAVAKRDVTPVLLEGLRRLEYRGYDSAGIAVIDHDTCIDRLRRAGKVQALAVIMVWRTRVGQRMASRAKPMLILTSVMVRLLWYITVSSKITASYGRCSSLPDFISPPKRTLK